MSMVHKNKHISSLENQGYNSSVDKQVANIHIGFLQECLQITNHRADMQLLLNDFIQAILKFSGCEAVGIRLLSKSGKIPYQAYQGFEQLFYDKESPLNITHDRCFCINVIKGILDTSLPFYTKGGSFLTNSTTEFLAKIPEEESTRNVCHEFGYESVALVPIRFQDRIVGLIHVADKKRGMLSPEIVLTLEVAVLALGNAVRRIRTEEKLNESKELSHSLLHLGAEAGESIVMLMNKDGKEGVQVLFNDEWPRLTGYSQEELQAMPFFNLLSAGDKEASILRHRRKMQGVSIPGLFEMHIQTKEGSARAIELTGAFTSVKKGKANVLFIRDITGRRKIERALTESENLYRTLFDTTGTATIIIEEGGIIGLVNQEWCNVTGYSKVEMARNRKAIDFVYIKDKKKAVDHFRAIDSEHQPFQVRMIDRDSHTINVLVSINVIPGTDKLIASFLNITNLKKTERELLHSEKRIRLLSNKLLMAQEEERERISRDLHDLLAQELALIKILAMSIASKTSDAALINKTQQLVDSADSLIKTTHRISVDLRPEMLDRLGLVKAAQWYAEDFERHTGISCPVIIESKVIDEEIKAIPKNISIAAYRIIQEAMTNVLRHAQANQTQVIFNLKRNLLSIKVVDDGIGMHLNKTNNTKSLGLLGMRERANAVGGTMKVISQIGGGTTIQARFKIPSLTNTARGENDD
jgi:PAS domain S-box-containing protein